MRVVFVHQNFPGQYRHIIQSLAAEGQHQLTALAIEARREELPKALHYVRYRPKRSNTRDLSTLLLETESKLIRGEACAEAALELREQGLQPDLICGHPGWGEMLFLRDIWPESPILTYQEFFYRSTGFDLDFDPEFQEPLGLHERARNRMKTANILLNLQASDWCVTPTQFQWSSYPDNWHSKMSVIHDGIDTTQVRPLDSPAPLRLEDGTILKRGQAIVTFVNRCLEPYRGCHTLIRAIPTIQTLAPGSRLVIVGATSGSSYGRHCPQGEWKDFFLHEIEGQYDPNRVHFTGPLPYATYLSLLQVSAAHVYLTYPFVLSWSLLEAMSSGCAVVGSATAPVEEVIQDGRNGLLVDFFKPQDLANAVVDLLNNREQAAQLGIAARRTILERYSLERCLPRQLDLLKRVANRTLSAD